jgi:hypothetical protein
MPTDRDALSLDLHTLAVEERFIEELRAGNHPRLSAYVRHYPAYAEALADLIASLAPDATTEQSPEAPPASPSVRAWAEAGERRALAALFGALPEESAGSDALRVAEERGEYTTGRRQDASLRDDASDS